MGEEGAGRCGTSGQGGQGTSIKGSCKEGGEDEENDEYEKDMDIYAWCTEVCSKEFGPASAF